MTENQAFRVDNAWGVLFHPEADFALVEAWLAVPEMIDEALAALGDDGRGGAAGAGRRRWRTLVRRTTRASRPSRRLVAANG